MHATFVDFVPGLCSLLGILAVILINKDCIRGEEGFSDSHAVWCARLFLFVGFSLKVGSLACSVVRPFCSHQRLESWRLTDTDYAYRLLVLKYVIIGYPPTSQRISLMLSSHGLDLRKFVGAMA